MLAGAPTAMQQWKKKTCSHCRGRTITSEKMKVTP